MCGVKEIYFLFSPWEGRDLLHVAHFFKIYYEPLNIFVMKKVKKDNGANEVGKIAKIEKLIREDSRDNAYQALKLLTEKNQFGYYSLLDCEKLRELYTELKEEVPYELVKCEFVLQKETNQGLIQYFDAVLTNSSNKLSLEEVWEVVFKKAMTFSKEQQEEIKGLLLRHGKIVEQKMFQQKIKRGYDLLGNAKLAFSQGKKWTIADFLRLFIAILIPAGMVFAQYYFWADINEFARENIQLLIGFMEIITGLVILYGLNKTFAIRSNRAQLEKFQYEILSKGIHTEEQIEVLKKKVIKWELSDLPDLILILLFSGGLVYVGLQNWFLEIFTIPFPSNAEYYTLLIINVIAVLLFVWLLAKSRKEKKEVCAAKISELQKYL